MHMFLLLGFVNLAIASTPDRIHSIDSRSHVTSPSTQSGDECVSKSFAIHNLTALAPQTVLDSAKPDNNAVVFQLFNPITEVAVTLNHALLSPPQLLSFTYLAYLMVGAHMSVYLPKISLVPS
ncbi:hypothetical protein GE09DRAFT_1065429 [Coniochaeta sp. 2T2.1]|nr:hypothetical protein GE09DRAFT_1065429 [Coniochaeta sp. 2T2.1]